MSTLFAYNIAEQRVQFISTLATQAENKGFRVTLRDSLNSKSELCATADKKVSMKEDSLEEEIYKKTEMSSIAEIIKSCESAINEKRSTKEIVMQLKIAKTLSYFPPEKLSLEDMRIVNKNRTIIFNLAGISKVDVKSLVAVDISRLGRCP